MTKINWNEINFITPMQAQVISPELAQKMLDTMGRNRTLSDKITKKYMAKLERDEWVLNGETIVFDDEGKLINGQHRLNAIIKTGIPMPTFIVSGISDTRAFATFDDGKGRSPADTLGLMGIKYPIEKAAIGKFLMLWDTLDDKKQYPQKSYLRYQFSNKQLASFIRESGIDYKIQRILDIFKGTQLFLSCPAGSMLVAGLIAINDVNPVMGESFMKELLYGGMDEGNPVLLLKQRFLFKTSGKKRSSEADKTEMLALMFKTFNLWVKGKKIKTLRWRQEGEYPEYFPEITTEG